MSCLAAALALGAGCGDGGNGNECAGEAPESIACGLNGKGAQDVVCQEGQWVGNGVCACNDDRTWDDDAGNCVVVDDGCDAGDETISGEGTVENPYLICSVAQLKAIPSKDSDATMTYFQLVANLDLNNEELDSLGDFYGTFDGGGHVISHMTLKEDHRGLFTSMGGAGSGGLKGAWIRDLVLRDVNVTGPQGAVANAGTGALVGAVLEDEAGGIEDVFVLGGSVKGGDHTGGLVGLMGSGVLRRVGADVSVHAGAHTGGLVGLSLVNVSDAWARGKVSGSLLAGGLIGSIGRIPEEGGEEPELPVLNVSRAWASGAVNSAESGGGLIGGATVKATIEDCGAIGAVISTGMGAGGLVGMSFGGLTIRRCWATGEVEAKMFVGGLAGYIEKDGIITNSWASGQVAATEGDAGGLLGAGQGANISYSWASGKPQSKGEEDQGAEGSLVGALAAPSSVNASFGRSHNGDIKLVGREFAGDDPSDLISIHGGSRLLSAEEFASAETFTENSWDFDKIWKMASPAGFAAPALQNAPVIPAE